MRGSDGAALACDMRLDLPAIAACALSASSYSAFTSTSRVIAASASAAASRHRSYRWSASCAAAERRTSSLRSAFSTKP
eukprot:62063-Prymnesium_polylepis.1